VGSTRVFAMGRCGLTADSAGERGGLNGDAGGGGWRSERENVGVPYNLGKESPRDKSNILITNDYSRWE
jgi:hypothetical protein